MVVVWEVGTTAYSKYIRRFLTGPVQECSSQSAAGWLCSS